MAINWETMEWPDPDQPRRSAPLDVKAIPESLRTAPVILGSGTVGGALLGRYLAAPILKRLGFESGKSKNALTVAGALVGALPGLLTALAMNKARGNWTSPIASNPVGAEQILRDASIRWHMAKNSSLGRVDPMGAIQSEDQIWHPTFGISSALNTVASNALASPVEKLQQMQLVARAGHEQGGGLTGLASPAALMKALPQVVSNAIPTVGGAMLLANVLGAPSWARKGGIGGALAYSAFKSFMNQ
jgi:hypothetical protein